MMVILNRSIRVIDYENNRVLSREIPPSFDEYVEELIIHINGNDSIREYKTRSRFTEVISGALEIMQMKDNEAIVLARTDSIANRLLAKEMEAQSRIGRLNTNVQKGSLIQALLFDVETKQYSYLLAKVEHGTFVDDLDFTFKTGFSKDKKTIWKSCLIDLSEPDSAVFCSKIYSNTAAKFWSDEFLEFDEMITDETNTSKSFRAIEATLNYNLKGIVTKDHTVIRNAFINYYKTKNHIDFQEMVESILENYDPIDIEPAKVQQIKEKLLQLPEKKGFDRQFNSMPKVINARIKKTYEINDGIELRITDAIEDIQSTIRAYREPDGTRYLKIKTNNDDTFRRFQVSE